MLSIAKETRLLRMVLSLESSPSSVLSSAFPRSSALAPTYTGGAMALSPTSSPWRISGRGLRAPVLGSRS